MIVCFERMNEVVLRNQKAESERYSVKEKNMIHFAIDYKNNCCIKNNCGVLTMTPAHNLLPLLRW